MKKEVIAEIENVIAALPKAIGVFASADFNKIPFTNSWTPAQVTGHLEKAVDPGILYGSVKTVDRDPGAKINDTKDVFLDFSIKMNAPDFTLPSDQPRTQDEMLQILTQVWTRMKVAAQTLDLAVTCTDFEIPGFGAFTRLEWIWFYIFHTQRHIHQLHKIADHLDRNVPGHSKPLPQ